MDNFGAYLESDRYMSLPLESECAMLNDAVYIVRRRLCACARVFVCIFVYSTSDTTVVVTL